MIWVDWKSYTYSGSLFYLVQYLDRSSLKGKHFNIAKRNLSLGHYLCHQQCIRVGVRSYIWFILAEVFKYDIYNNKETLKRGYNVLGTETESIPAMYNA